MLGIRLRNLRSLIDTGTVYVKPITLLVGKNNSGKSTFLRAFPLIRQSAETQKTCPIVWYGRYVDFGSFSEAVNLLNPLREITFEFTVPWQKSEVQSQWYELRPLDNCVLTASITMCQAEGRNDSRISSFRIQFNDSDVVEVKFNNESAVEQVRVNSTELRNSSKSLVPKQAYAGWHESHHGGRRLGAWRARRTCQAVICFAWLSLFHAPFPFHNI